MKVHAFILVLLCMPAISGLAQTGADSEARFKALEDRIHALEEQLQTLQAALTAAAPAQAPTPAPTQAAVPQPAAAAAPETAQSTASTLPVYGGSSSAA